MRERGEVKRKGPCLSTQSGPQVGNVDVRIPKVVRGYTRNSVPGTGEYPRVKEGRKTYYTLPEEPRDLTYYVVRS